MSITTRPGDTFTAIFAGAPNALGSTLTAGIRSLPNGVMVSAASTAGIVETDVGATSNYVATRTAPADTSLAYEVVWLIGGVENATEDLHVGGYVVAGGTLPTVENVAALLTARTVDGGNNYIGTFSALTTPTDVQVEALIEKAVRDVRRELGPELLTTEDTDSQADVRDLIALRAAMYVELSYYPEQANQDGSVYQQYLAMWEEGIASLKASLHTDPGDVQGYSSVPVQSPTRASYVDQISNVDPWF